MRLDSIREITKWARRETRPFVLNASMCLKLSSEYKL